MNRYTLLITACALLITIIAWARTRDWRVPAGAVLLAACALLVGRAGFVALYWPYFREHPNEIASLAGISEHAAILGGAIGYWLLAKARQPITNYQLPIAVALLLIGIAASLGCIPIGCGFGREVFWQTDGAGSLVWLLRADWPDATLTNNPRWPAQALLAGWFALGLVWIGLSARRGRSYDRSVLPAVVLWFAAGDFMLQPFRGDFVFMVASWRVFQGFDILLAGLSILVITGQILRKSNTFPPKT